MKQNLVAGDFLPPTRHMSPHQAGNGKYKPQPVAWGEKAPVFSYQGGDSHERRRVQRIRR
jgi:hypothetical protein